MPLVTVADVMSKIKGSAHFHNEVIEIYSALYKGYVGSLPRFENINKTRRQINNLLHRFTESQILALIFCHFEWRGPGGRDETQHIYLHNSRYPFAWISTNATDYQKYLMKIVGKETWDNDKKLSATLNEWEVKLFSSIREFIM